MTIIRRHTFAELHRAFSACAEICKVGRWPCLVVPNPKWNADVPNDTIATLAWQDYSDGMHHELRLSSVNIESITTENSVTFLRVAEFRDPLPITLLAVVLPDALMRALLVFDINRHLDNRPVMLHGGN